VPSGGAAAAAPAAGGAAAGGAAPAAEAKKEEPSEEDEVGFGTICGLGMKEAYLLGVVWQLYVGDAAITGCAGMGRGVTMARVGGRGGSGNDFQGWRRSLRKISWAGAVSIGLLHGSALLE
jgi:hypothetical protein